MFITSIQLTFRKSNIHITLQNHFYENNLIHYLNVWNLLKVAKYIAINSKSDLNLNCQKRVLSSIPFPGFVHKTFELKYLDYY